jgi:hypothetical protein
MDFTHTVLTAMIFAYGIVQAWSFAKIFQVLGKIHEESAKSRAASEVTLESAIEILKVLKARA